MKKTIITAAILALTSQAIYADKQYSIIMDGGSSGTRLHLYSYKTEDTLPKITEEFTDSVKPGLSAIQDPSTAGASLKKLFDEAESKLKDMNVSEKDVPLHLMATAGMRLLPVDKQNAIYANITDYLNNKYNFKKVKAETIPGQFEGLYDWLDVNYLENKFDGSSDTIGAIDMGGASTEIVYATDDLGKPSDEIKLTINNKTYMIFSKSFLGLGQDQARGAMNQNANAGSCYPTGFTNGAALTGKYNFAQCSAAYANVIAPFAPSQALANYGNTTFAVFSGAAYTYQFFGVEDATQGALEARMSLLCNMSWPDLQKEHVGDAHLSEYCANGAFVDQLFYNNYHLPAAQMWVSNKSHDGRSIDWALGAVFYSIITKDQK